MAATEQALNEVRAAYPNATIEIVKATGVGEQGPQALQEVIEREKPAVVLVRSETKAFSKKEKAPGFNYKEFVNNAARNGVKAVVRMGAGYDNIDEVYAAEQGISVIRTHGNANSVADLTLFLMSSLGKMEGFNVTPLSQAPTAGWTDIAGSTPAEYSKLIAKSKKWQAGVEEAEKQAAVGEMNARLNLTDEPMAGLANALNGKTIGLLGFGPIAQAVAEKLQEVKEATGAEFTVIANTRSFFEGGRQAESTRSAADLGVTPVSRADLLARADILSLHVPEVDELKLKAEELSANTNIKAVINTARSGLIADAAAQDFVARGGVLVGDFDLTAGYFSLMRQNPSRVAILPHIGASTKDGGAGVEENTVTALKEMAGRLLGATPTAGLDIVNGVQLKPLVDAAMLSSVEQRIVQLEEKKSVREPFSRQEKRWVRVELSVTEGQLQGMRELQEGKWALAGAPALRVRDENDATIDRLENLIDRLRVLDRGTDYAMLSEDGKTVAELLVSSFDFGLVKRQDSLSVHTIRALRTQGSVVAEFDEQRITAALNALVERDLLDGAGAAYWLNQNSIERMRKVSQDVAMLSGDTRTVAEFLFLASQTQKIKFNDNFSVERLKSLAADSVVAGLSDDQIKKALDELVGMGIMNKTAGDTFWMKQNFIKQVGKQLRSGGTDRAMLAEAGQNSNGSRFEIFQAPESVSLRHAKEAADIIAENNSRGEKSVIMLFTGTRGKAMSLAFVKQIVDRDIDLSNAKFFYLDEYWMGARAKGKWHNDPRSYKYFSTVNFVAPLNADGRTRINESQVFVLDGEAEDITTEIAKRDRLLDEALQEKAASAPGAKAQFDIVNAGSGSNGHLAFIEKTIEINTSFMSGFTDPANAVQVRNSNKFLIKSDVVFPRGAVESILETRQKLREEDSYKADLKAGLERVSAKTVDEAKLDVLVGTLQKQKVSFYIEDLSERDRQEMVEAFPGVDIFDAESMKTETVGEEELAFSTIVDNYSDFIDQIDEMTGKALTTKYAPFISMSQRVRVSAFGPKTIEVMGDVSRIAQPDSRLPLSMLLTHPDAKFILDWEAAQKVDRSGLKEITINTGDAAMLGEIQQKYDAQITGVSSNISSWRPANYPPGVVPHLDSHQALINALEKDGLLTAFDARLMRVFVEGHDLGYSADLKSPEFMDQAQQVWDGIGRIVGYSPEKSAEISKKIRDMISFYANFPEVVAWKVKQLEQDPAYKSLSAEDLKKVATALAGKESYMVTRVIAHGTTSIVLARNKLKEQGFSDDQALGLAYIFAAHHAGYPITMVNQFVISGVIPVEYVPVLLVTDLPGSGIANTDESLRQKMADAAARLLNISPLEARYYATLGFALDRITPARMMTSLAVNNFMLNPDGNVAGQIAWGGAGETIKKYPLIVTNIKDAKQFTVSEIFRMAVGNLKKEAEAAIKAAELMGTDIAGDDGATVARLRNLIDQRSTFEIGQTEGMHTRILNMISARMPRFSGDLTDVDGLIRQSFQLYSQMPLGDADRASMEYLLGFLITIKTSALAQDHLKSVTSTEKKAQGVDRIIKTALKGVLTGQHFDTEHLSVFIQAPGVTIQKFNEGDIIIRQGEIGADMYVLQEGEVNIVVGAQTVATEFPGALLGEISALTGTPRTADVVAATPVTLVRIPASQSRQMINQDIRPFVELVSERLKQQNTATDSQIIHRFTRSTDLEPFGSKDPDGEFIQKLNDPFLLGKIGEIEANLAVIEVGDNGFPIEFERNPVGGSRVLRLSSVLLTARSNKEVGFMLDLMKNIHRQGFEVTDTATDQAISLTRGYFNFLKEHIERNPTDRDLSGLNVTLGNLAAHYREHSDNVRVLTVLEYLFNFNSQLRYIADNDEQLAANMGELAQKLTLLFTVMREFPLEEREDLSVKMDDIFKTFSKPGGFIYAFRNMTPPDAGFYRGGDNAMLAVIEDVDGLHGENEADRADKYWYDGVAQRAVASIKPTEVWMDDPRLQGEAETDRRMRAWLGRMSGGQHISRIGLSDSNIPNVVRRLQVIEVPVAEFPSGVGYRMALKPQIANRLSGEIDVTATTLGTDTAGDHNYSYPESVDVLFDGRTLTLTPDQERLGALFNLGRTASDFPLNYYVGGDKTKPVAANLRLVEASSVLVSPVTAKWDVEFDTLSKRDLKKATAGDSAMLSTISNLVGQVNGALDDQLFGTDSVKNAIEVTVEVARDSKEAAAMRLNAAKNLDGTVIFPEQGLVILGSLRGKESLQESNFVTRTFVRVGVTDPQRFTPAGLKQVLAEAASRLVPKEYWDGVEALKSDVAMLAVRDNIDRLAAQISNIPYETGLSSAKSDRMYELKEQAEELLAQAQAADILTIELQSIESDLARISNEINAIKRRVVSTGFHKSNPRGFGNQSDAAMLTDQPEYGGIDLDTSNFKLQIKRDEGGIPLPLQMQDISNIHIEGFVPTIIEITPVTNLPVLMGLNDSTGQPIAMSDDILSEKYARLE